MTGWGMDEINMGNTPKHGQHFPRMLWSVSLVVYAKQFGFRLFRDITMVIIPHKLGYGGPIRIMIHHIRMYIYPL